MAPPPDPAALAPYKLLALGDISPKSVGRVIFDTPFVIRLLKWANGSLSAGDRVEQLRRVLDEYNRVDRFRQVAGMTATRFEARWALFEWHTDPTRGFRDVDALHHDNARIVEIISWSAERRNSYFASGRVPRPRVTRPNVSSTDLDKLTGIETWAHSALMLMHLFAVQRRKTPGDGPERRLKLLEEWQDAVVSDLGGLGALEHTVAVDELFGMGRQTYAGQLCKWGSWRDEDEIRRASLNGAGDLHMLRAMHASHFGIGGYKDDGTPTVLLTEDKGLMLAHAATREVFAAKPVNGTLVALDPAVSLRLLKVDTLFTENQNRIFEEQVSRAAAGTVPQKAGDELLEILDRRVADLVALL